MRGFLIHPTAIVEPWVSLGANVEIGPYAIVGRKPMRSKALAREADTWIRHTQIGDGVVIGAHAIVYCDVVVGDDTLIADAAHVREGVRIGKRCVIGAHAQINYNAMLEDDVRVQHDAHVTGGCTVGAGSFIGPGVLTSNDRNVDLEDYHFPGEHAPVIGKRVLVGTGANILAGTTIGDGAVIASGAVVVKDVAAGARVFGPKAVAR
jgi:acetyltransferase-like isoleucine patch superfamily enzyme